jgi:hypothetical protein
MGITPPGAAPMSAIPAVISAIARESNAI